MGGRQKVGKARWGLWHLSKEPSDETNLAKVNPEKCAELIALSEKMNGEMSEPLF